MSQEVVQMSLQAQNVGMFHNSAFRAIYIKKFIKLYSHGYPGSKNLLNTMSSGVSIFTRHKQKLPENPGNLAKSPNSGFIIPSKNWQTFSVLMMSDTRVHCLSIKLSRYLSINTTQTAKPLLKDKVLLVCLPVMNDIHNLPNIHIFCQLVVGLKEKASHLSQIIFTGTALRSMTTFQKQIKSFVGLCYNLGNKVYTS